MLLRNPICIYVIDNRGVTFENLNYRFLKNFFFKGGYRMFYSF